LRRKNRALTLGLRHGKLNRRGFSGRGRGRKVNVCSKKKVRNFVFKRVDILKKTEGGNWEMSQRGKKADVSSHEYWKRVGRGGGRLHRGVIVSKMMGESVLWGKGGRKEFVMKKGDTRRESCQGR